MMDLRSAGCSVRSAAYCGIACAITPIEWPKAQELDLDVVQRIQVREPVAYRAIEQRIILQELAMIRHGEQGLDRVVMLPANAFEDRLS